MHSVFLIGATGNVGRHLLHLLAPDHAAARMRVRIAVRSAAGVEHVRAAGLEAVAFDLDDRRGFDAALAGSETIFLLRPYTIGQMMQGKQVIDAAKRAGAGSLVLVGAHGRPETPHPVIGWNFLVEAYAERSGLGWTHIRPNFFMENVLAQRDATGGTIANRVAVPVSWAASEDIAAVSAAVLRDPAAHHGQAYPIATDRRSVAEIAALFETITGLPHRAVQPARDTMRVRLIAAGREPVYADPLIDYVDAINAGDVPEAAETFDSVERIAGRPGMTWEKFIRQSTGR